MGCTWGVACLGSVVTSRQILTWPGWVDGSRHVSLTHAAAQSECCLMLVLSMLCAHLVLVCFACLNDCLPACLTDWLTVACSAPVTPFLF